MAKYHHIRPARAAQLMQQPFIYKFCHYRGKKTPEKKVRSYLLQFSGSPRPESLSQVLH